MFSTNRGKRRNDFKKRVVTPSSSWRGTILIVLLLAMGFVVFSLLLPDKQQPSQVLPDFIRLPAAEVVITDDHFINDAFVSIVPEVEVLLEEHANNRVLGSWIRTVEGELSSIRSLIESTKEHRAGITVDVILQNHGEEEEIQQGAHYVLRSQEIVYRHLEKERYDVVAVEGSALDPVNVHNLAVGMMAYEKSQGRIVKEKEALESAQTIFSTSGGLRYAEAFPAALVIGSEEESLTQLHRTVLDEMLLGMKTGSNQCGLSQFQLGQLNNVLSRLRSEVALARTVRKLEKYDGHRGAIVIGYAHKDDLLEILPQLHIRSSIYNATSVQR